VTAARTLALAGLLVAGRALADSPRLSAVATPRPPVIDGRLDDAVWQLATPSSAFTQKFPEEGRAPSERTTVRVLYDREALYVGIVCEQRLVPVIRRLTRRDRPIESDSVTVSIDSRHDGTSAFELSVNAAGVLADGIRFNDTDLSTDWDENWDARVALAPDRGGWSAELRIPLKILRFDAAAEQEWGLQVRRYTSARQETDEWAFIPRDTAGEVSHYGRLVGLKHLKNPSPFELRPFVLGRVRRRDAATGALASGWDYGGALGLDFKWHVTQNLTLDATIDPDFAQVEADQVVLNLSTFEVYYPEKRPFFLEGIDTFASPIQVLYTRRIGRVPPAPALRTSAPFGEQLVDVPDPSTIYGAAKLTGTLGKRWTVGLLSALTAANSVQAQTADGFRLRRTADPLSLYNVARVKLAVGDNAHVGLIATTTNRFESLGTYPITPASDAGPTLQTCPDGSTGPVGARCFHDAYVGGLDVRWRSPSGGYTVGAQAITSAIENGPPRLFPDGTTIGSGAQGFGGNAWVAKEGGTHWLWFAEYDWASRKLDYNDLGYMTRQNAHHTYAELQYRTLTPFWKALETASRVEFFTSFNLDGLTLSRGYQINTWWRYANFWTVWTELHFRERHFDDREVGDGTALEREGLLGWELWVTSDPRRRVYFEFGGTAQGIFNGFNSEFDAKLSLRVLPQLDLDLSPQLIYTFGEPRYVGAGDTPGALVFGKLEARGVGATLRATWTFTPRLSLQVYAQLFLASKHYTDFSSFRGGGGIAPRVRLADLQSSAPPTLNPDFEEGSLNINVVLRWEYRLGSTLFFVYTRSQVPNVTLLSDQEATLDLGAIRSAPAADVLLLKLTYWWG
jgi:hypothetical protein